MVLYSNDMHSILLIKEHNQYKLYLKSIKYDQLFTLKSDINYQQYKNFVNLFFSAFGNNDYKTYILSDTIQKHGIEGLELLKHHDIESDIKALSRGEIPAIKDLNQIDILNLKGYKFQDQDIEQLVKIKELTHIKQINLDDNNIGVKGLKSILEANSLHNLQKLSIRNNKFNFQDNSLDIINVLHHLEMVDLSNNKLNISDKEIRDNIASISFSSVSFISGIALVVMGAGTPAGIAVGLALMVLHGIYSGISNIIEYEEKYDTTHGENWSIFWRTVLMQNMAPDIEHLAARTGSVNDVAEEAWKNLENSPINVVAYATGFGKTILYKKKENCKIILKTVATQASIARYNVTECEVNIISELKLDSASIHMHGKNANTENLSRVLPKTISEEATMICLPEITDADYEKDIRKSVPTAEYYCDNAMVIMHSKRQESKKGDQWIIYDLKYINKGMVIGSNELHNAFLIYGGTTTINGGNNTLNHFIFTSNTFKGITFFLLILLI